MPIAKRLWQTFTLIVISFGLLQLWFFSHVLWWQHINPTQTAFMEARLYVLRQNDPDATLKHQWRDSEHISKNLKRAVIAAEDSLFFTHQGFDWKSLKSAWQQNARKGKVVRGGSTISQQLAKNLFLSGNRSLLRKGQEALITVMIEGTMSKHRTLELYLNLIEWGDGVYGAEAAARHYFNKSANQLSAYEAAKLAAIIPQPRFYDKHRHTRRLNHKIKIIKQRMRQISLPN